MENKFTKGVLERQQREYNKHFIEQSPPLKSTERVSEDSPSALHLSDLFEQGGERKAKNKTFYLDNAVIQAIKKAASDYHITESKLVNDILKKILFSEN